LFFIYLVCFFPFFPLICAFTTLRCHASADPREPTAAGFRRARIHHGDANQRMSAGPVGRHTGTVGYNPYRKYRAKPADYVVVAAALTAAIGLAVWGLFG
jgi:hypothetical protein